MTARVNVRSVENRNGSVTASGVENGNGSVTASGVENGSANATVSVGGTENEGHVDQVRPIQNDHGQTMQSVWISGPMLEQQVGPWPVVEQGPPSVHSPW